MPGIDVETELLARLLAKELRELIQADPRLRLQQARAAQVVEQVDDHAGIAIAPLAGDLLTCGRCALFVGLSRGEEKRDVGLGLLRLGPGPDRCS